jgi:hypothetical protein
MIQHNGKLDSQGTGQRGMDSADHGKKQDLAPLLLVQTMAKDET